MEQIIAAILRLSNRILNTISYASGLINSLRDKNFTQMGKVRKVSHDRVRRELKEAVKEREAVREAFHLGVQEKIQITPGKGAIILDVTQVIKQYANKIQGVMRQYSGGTGAKTAKSIAVGVISWTNLKELILPIDCITWTKGDRPKNQTLIERAIRSAQQLGVSTILADAFFATRYSFSCLAQTGIIAVMRFKSNISVYVEGFGKCQLRNHPAFKFQRNEHCIIRSVVWHGFHLQVIALRFIDKKSNWKTLFLVTNASFEKAREYAAFYRRRWKIEPLFRDTKQTRGLEDCQARSLEMQHAHFYSCLLAYYIENFNKQPEPSIKKKPRKHFTPIFRKKRNLKLRPIRSMRTSHAVA